MKRFLSFILSFFILFAFAGCDGQKAQQKYTASFIDLFDTASTIAAYDTSQAAFDEHYKQFYDELSEYSKLYDIYEAYDGVVNIKYVNENAGTAPVRVDKKIMDLLIFGKEAFEKSAGKVNICMGSVLSVWHEARENALENPESAALPDTNLLAQKARHTDISNLVLDEYNMTVFFADPEMTLDVGAIAKGYAAEKISEYILENGLWQSAVISLGGNIKTIGYKDLSAEVGFKIGIQEPNGYDYLATVSASNGDSVVTSGDYQRYFTVDGMDYCHIINPETLMPADFCSSVSVICKDSGYADMMSTALFNMSIEDGLELAEADDSIEAMWLDKAGNNITFSSGWQSYMV